MLETNVRLYELKCRMWEHINKRDCCSVQECNQIIKTVLKTLLSYFITWTSFRLLIVNVVLIKCPT